MRTRLLLPALVALPLPVAASPDLLLVTGDDAPAVVEQVRAILEGQLPELQVSAEHDTPGPLGPAVARVTIDTWADGRLAVSYRDADGRETLRLVEPGPDPAATIAMIVVNFQADQLDDVLGAPGPVPRPAPAAAMRPARVRAAVHPPTWAAPAIALRAGFGVMNRSLDVEVLGSATPRSYRDTYPLLGVDLNVFPFRLLPMRGLASWIGAELTLRRAAGIDSIGTDATTGEPIDVGATYREVSASLLVDAPLSSRPDGARVRLSVGYRDVQFGFDPVQMMRLDPSSQMPSFEYPGVVAGALAEVPIADTGLRVHAAGGVHAVTDVGQPVRDLFGADTEGATGLFADVGVGGRLVDWLEWGATFELRRFSTEMHGATSASGGTIGAFPSATDRSLAGRLHLSARSN